MLLRVFERQQDKNGKTVLTIKKNKYKIPYVTSQTKTFYMDLSSEEEQKLAKTGFYGFEAIPSMKMRDITKKQRDDGLVRKKEIFTVETKTQ